MGLQDNITYEKSLLERIRNNNDTEAYKTLYRRYYIPLVAYARQFVDADEAEDIVQSFLSALWSKRKFLIINKTVSSYFFSSIRNSCLNSITRNNLRGHILTELKLSIIDECAFFDTSDANEIIRIVKKCLNEMPEAQRQAFELSRFSGKSYEEIAQIDNISVKTVEYRISQALKKLRDALKEYLPAIVTLLAATVLLG